MSEQDDGRPGGLDDGSMAEMDRLLEEWGMPPVRDRQGNEIGSFRAMMLAADRDYTTVGDDTDRGWQVSTTWIPGLAWIPGGEIYETMIFTPDGDPYWARRWKTEDEAVGEHAAAFAFLRDLPDEILDRLIKMRRTLEEALMDPNGPGEG